MKITPVCRDVNFGRMLNNEELKEYEKVLEQGKKVVGQTGNSIFIMPTQSLPQSPEMNTGIGHLTDKTTQEYIKYMHSMLGFNVREDLPPGQITPYANNFFCNYQSTSLALGDQNINPQLLTSDEYANLLTKEDVKEIVSSNKRPDKDRFANFNNIMDENGGQNQALKKAYKKFESLVDSHPLKTRYKNYIKENSEWIDFLYKDKGDFFKFKQFLADEHHAKGNEFLHSIGVKSCGDCLIGATPEEVKARPFAFALDWNMGWVLATPDIEKILDPASDAHKYMKYKIQNFARRYDMLRMDVGWAYIQPRLFKNYNPSEIKKPYFGDKIMNLIENWVKEVKGNDFDPKNIIWEVEAGLGDFEWEKNGKMIEPLQNRVKIYSSMYMSDNWASNDAFLKRNFGADNFIIGLGNHDHQPIREIANDIPYPQKAGDKIIYEHPKKNSIAPLAKIFNMDEKLLEDPVEYRKTKSAEHMMAKHTMSFFMDDFGYDVRFDKHSFNCEDTPTENYAHKIRYDWKKQYHDAVESGWGANKMDSLERIFKAKGYDNTNPQLYKLIVKYRDILNEKTVSKETAPTSETAQEASGTAKSIFKNKYFIPFIAAGTLAIAAGVHYYIKKHKPKIHENTDTRPSLVKTA